MSSDLNQCNFIGRLGKDPEIKYMANGDPIANFSIACGEKYKKKDGTQVENTEWVNLVAFRGLAKVIGDYLKRGSKVYISGKFKTNKWQDKEGNTRYSTSIVVSDMQMLDTRGTENVTDSNQAQPQNSAPQPATNTPEFDDDIPF